ncbi:hypothetical protein ElyMa_005509700 [Elysia marginata]|uniref:SH3 domain-containing protein n=1 Tax=Elysia marginata TaxID=1093978 RepID=A0AAV4EWL6_9GAST|nr:hypothetical protein ElyMa_005509700 [Elysia marginata]
MQRWLSSKGSLCGFVCGGWTKMREEGCLRGALHQLLKWQWKRWIGFGRSTLHLLDQTESLRCAGVVGHRQKGSIGPVEIDLRAGLPVWKVTTGMQGYVSPERRYRSRGEKSYDLSVHCREYAGYESVRYISPERECKPCGDRLEGRTSYLGDYDGYERGYGTWRERAHDQTVDMQKYAGYEKARSSQERVYKSWGNKSRDRAVDLQEYGGYERTRYVSPERGYGTLRERFPDRTVDLQEYAGYEKARWWRDWPKV